MVMNVVLVVVIGVVVVVDIVVDHGEPLEVLMEEVAGCP